MNGKLFIVSSGPGHIDQMTVAAKEAINESLIIVGYYSYIKHIHELLVDKVVIQNGMRQEVDRCRAAIVQAMNGNTVSLVSGGDAGVYGLAGLVLELLGEDNSLEVEVLPGVTSATACASVLGAPLSHDFAVISLSNLLTDKGLILKRIKLAAEGDFVTILYNPMSSKRTELFYQMVKIFKKNRALTTPVGIVKNCYRDVQKVKIVGLDNLQNEDWIDMRSTIIIGNSQTKIENGFMITPRGYSV